MQVACERAFGDSDLGRRSVAVMGLGHVGADLARRLAAEGARLVLSDIDPAGRALADQLGAEWASPEDVLFSDVDVLAPCALGGVFDHDSVPRLRARVIAGAANNQLADASVDGLLAGRGILWAPDFVVNAGGIVNIAVEFQPGGYDEQRADRDVRAMADTMRLILDEVDSSGVTPLAAAMMLARTRIKGPEGSNMRVAGHPSS
jgi:leucine dehydrogenase